MPGKRPLRIGLNIPNGTGYIITFGTGKFFEASDTAVSGATPPNVNLNVQSLYGVAPERIRVIHNGVGGITESDVLLAAASNAIIIGFNIRPEPKASDLAEKEHVDVRLYTIIYNALNDIKAAMEGLLEPTLKERVLGRAEVRNPALGADPGPGQHPHHDPAEEGERGDRRRLERMLPDDLRLGQTLEPGQLLTPLLQRLELNAVAAGRLVLGRVVAVAFER